MSNMNLYVPYRRQQPPQQTQRRLRNSGGGSIVGAIKGLFGIRDDNGLTTAKMVVTLNDSAKLRSHVAEVYETLTRDLVNSGTRAIRDTDQIVNITINNLVGESVDVTIDNRQTMQCFSITEINHTVVNNSVSQRVDAIVNSISDLLKQQTAADLNTVSAAKNKSSLLDSLLKALPSFSGDANTPLNTIIEGSHVIQQALEVEKTNIVQQTKSAEAVRDFATEITSRVRQQFTATLSNVSASNSARVVLKTDQNVKAIEELVKATNLVSRVFDAINSSDSFMVARELSTELSAQARTTQTTEKTSETFTDVFGTVSALVGTISWPIAAAVVGIAVMLMAGREQQYYEEGGEDEQEEE